MIRRYITLFIIGVLGVLALTLANRTPYTIDVTRSRINTLDSHSQYIVRQLKVPVRIRAYFQDGTDEQALMRRLLDQYRLSSPRISYELIDPDRFPDRTARDQVDTGHGTVIIESEGRQRRLYYSDLFTPNPYGESQFFGMVAITDAISALVNTPEWTVYFSQGHGEKSISDVSGQGFSRVARTLIADNRIVATSNLFNTSLPTRSIIVVAAPTAPFSKLEAAAVEQFVSNGGALIILADFGSIPPVQPLLARRGIKLFTQKIIYDPDGSHAKNVSILIPSIPSSPVSNSLSKELPVLMPVATPLILEADYAKYALAPVVMTTERAWASSHVPTGNPQFNLESDDIGPFAVGVLSLPASGGPIAIFSDSDWVTNEFIDTPGNRLLILQTIRYLAHDTNNTPVSIPEQRQNVLILTGFQWRTSIGLLIAFGLSIVIIGVLKWYRYRNG
ncbi:hypothetical protein EBR96_00150 [bacterium]|nr:hypothetical protein [bacterium]